MIPEKYRQEILSSLSRSDDFDEDDLDTYGNVRWFLLVRRLLEASRIRRKMAPDGPFMTRFMQQDPYMYDE